VQGKALPAVGGVAFIYGGSGLAFIKSTPIPPSELCPARPVIIIASR